MTKQFIRIALVLFVSSISSLCLAQWYQGPSGGNGGNPFDHWKATNGAKDVKAVTFLLDPSIRCISVLYREPAPLGQQVNNGYCDPPPGPLQFNGFQSITLDPDEYILGIDGRYGDRVDSIRIYTNKRTSQVFGDKGGDATFSYTAPQGQMIAAFIGRAGNKLDAIGVMYAPCTPQKKPCR